MPTLFEACARGDLQALKRLLQKPVRAEQGSSQLTALHVAAANGQREVCRILVGAGACVNAVAADGQTPLHHAAGSAFAPDTIGVLLELGAAIDAVDGEGWTAAHDAAWRGSWPALATLMDAGADMAITDMQGYRAIDVAWQFGHEDLVKELGRRAQDTALCEELPVASDGGRSPRPPSVPPAASRVPVLAMPPPAKARSSAHASLAARLDQLIDLVGGEAGASRRLLASRGVSDLASLACLYLFLSSWSSWAASAEAPLRR